jgi:hypothetical protein
MVSYSPHVRQTLREIEAFTGNILGKSRGRENKRTRENNKELSDRFGRDVGFTVKQITNEEQFDPDLDDDEKLPRAIACFAVGMENKSQWWQLESFKYVAAAVCLEQLAAWRGGRGLRKLDV